MNIYIWIAVDHILSQSGFQRSGINVLNLILGGRDRRRDVEPEHLDETGKSAEIAAADQSKQRAGVEPLLFGCQPDAQFI